MLLGCITNISSDSEEDSDTTLPSFGRDVEDSSDSEEFRIPELSARLYFGSNSKSDAFKMVPVNLNRSFSEFKDTLDKEVYKKLQVSAVLEETAPKLEYSVSWRPRIQIQNPKKPIKFEERSKIEDETGYKGLQLEVLASEKSIKNGAQKMILIIWTDITNPNGGSDSTQGNQNAAVEEVDEQNQSTRTVPVFILLY
jgi:hypothetical protein